MDLTSVVLFVLIAVVGIIGVIIAKSPPVQQTESASLPEGEALDLADGWDQSRKAPHPWLLPVGVIFLVSGVVATWLAFTMDVSAPGYSGTANIDAVGVRTMCLVLAVSQWLVGWLLCCTAMIIRAVARFS